MSHETTRMVLVDPVRRWVDDATVDALPGLLGADDLLVLNDAATLPASLFVQGESGQQLELRLLEGPYRVHTRAILFGAGDYRMRTEDRPSPPHLAPGAKLRCGELVLTVDYVAEASSRLLIVRWPDSLEQRFALLYRHGRPVQYSYVPEPLALWDVQTTFAARPWAVEMPSAARPLSARILQALQERGVQLATLTHAAGLSASGEPALDAMLPLPERYEIPPATVQRVHDTRRAGGRVIAVGTSVVRALEDSAARHGTLRAGTATAELLLAATSKRRVVDGLLTGIHIPGESHYRLLQAFADDDTLRRSVELAHLHGYRAHEFGDAALIVPGLSLRARLAA